MHTLAAQSSGPNHSQRSIDTTTYGNAQAPAIDTIASYSPRAAGAASVRAGESCAGIWPVQVQGGAASVLIEGRGALGPHQAIVLIDGKIAGAGRRLFTLTASTTIVTGQPRIDDLYPRLRGFLAQDAVEYMLDGYRV